MSSLAVVSRSFSQNPVLRKKVKDKYPDAIFNDKGIAYKGKGLINFLKGHEKAITALEIIDESILSKLPKLKIISKYGVGLDMIDLDAMKKYNVKLAWTAGINKRSVSEMVISSAISLLHRSVFANQEVNKGKWYQVKGRQLSNSIFGIIGCGNIGKDLVQLLKQFNCKIVVNDIKNYKKFYKDNNIKSVELGELLKVSDIISLHLPLDQSTKNILNKKRLKLLKKNSILINFSRGGLIDETELKKILVNNDIAGAALDVFKVEPPHDNSFSKINNVLVTPHIGGSTEEAILAMGISAIKGLENAKDPLLFKK